MMKLLYQTHSPYARKVLVMAHETGLADRLEVVHQETSPMRRNETVFAANPLGKVPVLITADGLLLFDSVVICEYLDLLQEGPRLIPERGEARWRALRLQALAQGLADAGIALRVETERRPEGLRWAAFAEGQAEKLQSAYDALERNTPFAGPLDIGQIALATALSWLEFRAMPAFRDGRPGLARWYEAFAARPSMLATPLAGATMD